MADYFQFEADFIDSLRCIPMQVRFKLDTCGIKLKLAQWNQFSQADRQALVDRACSSGSEVQDYQIFLKQLVQDRTGMAATELAVDPNPAWLDGTLVPTPVQERAQLLGCTISLEQWASLRPLQRFALIKLSRSSHESNNFLPALKEFHLV